MESERGGIKGVGAGLYWLFSETGRAITSPIGVAGGFLDAIRGWRYSRQWLRFWFHLPSAILILTVYLTYAFSMFERTDGKVQRYAVAGEQVLSTRTMERASFSGFKFMSPGDAAKELEGSRASDKFARQYAQLLAERVITIQSTNPLARYRLALLKGLEGDLPGAKEDMARIADGEYGVFAPANAWIACSLVQAKEDGGRIDPQELGRHLKTGTEWNEVPVQLVSLYSQLLEQNGYIPNAVAMAKEAARRMPELNLELARLYHRTKNEDGLRETSYAVEDVFGSRINTGQERDIDRLAIAEVRFLTGNNTQAINILQEAINNSGAARPNLVRGLSSLKTSIFEKSVQMTGDGKYTADLSILESAADTDSNDPKISEQITKLIRRGIRPSKKLVDVLRKQIDSGITTAEAHSMLAEGFYMQGNEKEAVKNWEIALTKNPNDLSACNNLALCVAKSGKNNMPRALELVERALANSPENPEVLDTYGEILMLADEPKDAINRFEKAIKIDPNRVGTRKKLVTAYEKAGLREMARAQADVVKSLEAKEPR